MIPKNYTRRKIICKRKRYKRKAAYNKLKPFIIFYSVQRYNVKI